jgi:hypothetical protein
MTKLIVNCETGEIVERELTTDEIAQQEKDEIIIEERNLQRKKNSEAKKVILDKLGITEEEVKLLLG